MKAQRNQINMMIMKQRRPSANQEVVDPRPPLLLLFITYHSIYSQLRKLYSSLLNLQIDLPIRKGIYVTFTSQMWKTKNTRCPRFPRRDKRILPLSRDLGTKNRLIRLRKQRSLSQFPTFYKVFNTSRSITKQPITKKCKIRCCP